MQIISDENLHIAANICELVPCRLLELWKHVQMTVYLNLRSKIIFRMCATSADKLNFRGDSELCQSVYLISPMLWICLDPAGF